MRLVKKITSMALLGISGVLEFVQLIQDDANERTFDVCAVLETFAFLVSSSSYLKWETVIKCTVIAAELVIKHVHFAPLHCLNILSLLNLYEIQRVPRLLAAVSCISMPELVPLHLADRIIQKYTRYLDMKQRKSTFVFSSVIQGFVAICSVCFRLLQSGSQSAFAFQLLSYFNLQNSITMKFLNSVQGNLCRVMVGALFIVEFIGYCIVNGELFDRFACIFYLKVFAI